MTLAELEQADYFGCVIWIELAGINFVCALLAFALMAHAVARLRWRNRGVLFVFVAIFISAQIWLVPQFVNVLWARTHVPLYWLWCADWIVTAFAVVILWCRLKDLGRDQFDAAQIDGVGLFGVYWHVVLPLVSRTLGLFAVLMLLTLAVSFFARMLEVQSAEQFHFYAPSAGLLVTCSALATLPLFAIFLIAKKVFVASP